MSAFRTDAERWNAVESRSPEADGCFVFAVITTGVFCRPSCSSRKALRKNVRFFDSGHAAETAGFRPCKRCAPTEMHRRDERAARMVRACRLLEGAENTKTAEVAQAVAMSPFHFHRLFKTEIGVTPQAYRRRVLAERAKSEMERGASVTAAIFDAGYSSASRFYEATGQELGMSPKRVQRGGAGERVTYVVRQCSLGHVLIAWTARGVADVRFGDTPEESVVALMARFPKATFERTQVPAWVSEVVLAVERPRALSIPIDVEGTAFQERVWAELGKIPVGETRTYTDVANAIGKKNGARAVARACASNSLAVVIPCHRVVRGDGEDSGYRWGIERKRTLLARETREAGSAKGREGPS